MHDTQLASLAIHCRLLLSQPGSQRRIRSSAVSMTVIAIAIVCFFIPSAMVYHSWQYALPQRIYGTCSTTYADTVSIGCDVYAFSAVAVSLCVLCPSIGILAWTILAGLRYRLATLGDEGYELDQIYQEFHAHLSRTALLVGVNVIVWLEILHYHWLMRFVVG